MGEKVLLLDCFGQTKLMEMVKFDLLSVYLKESADWSWEREIEVT